MEITNASALVTGGASGLGFATVLRLLSAGAGNVVMVDLPTSAGQELAAQLGERVHFIEADVRDSTR